MREVHSQTFCLLQCCPDAVCRNRSSYTQSHLHSRIALFRMPVLSYATHAQHLHSHSANRTHARTHEHVHYASTDFRNDGRIPRERDRTNGQKGKSIRAAPPLTAYVCVYVCGLCVNPRALKTLALVHTRSALKHFTKLRERARIPPSHTASRRAERSGPTTACWRVFHCARASAHTTAHTNAQARAPFRSDRPRNFREKQQRRTIASASVAIDDDDDDGSAKCDRQCSPMFRLVAPVMSYFP